MESNFQTKKLKAGHPEQRRTGRQTVGRNITRNLTCVIAMQITDPSSRQRGRFTSTNPQLSKKKLTNWSRVPDGCLTPGRTGRLTVGRNITLTLSGSSSAELTTILYCLI
jgi:hypothetical protein